MRELEEHIEGLERAKAKSTSLENSRSGAAIVEQVVPSGMAGNRLLHRITAFLHFHVSEKDAMLETTGIYWRSTRLD